MKSEGDFFTAPDPKSGRPRLGVVIAGADVWLYRQKDGEIRAHDCNTLPSPVRAGAELEFKTKFFLDKPYADDLYFEMTKDLVPAKLRTVLEGMIREKGRSTLEEVYIHRDMTRGVVRTLEKGDAGLPDALKVHSFPEFQIEGMNVVFRGVTRPWRANGECS